MAFIDTDYVDNAIGSSVRQKVAPSTEAFDQYEAQARDIVKAACSIAGYSLSDTTTSDRVKLMTLGQWVVLAYGLQKGLEIPPSIRTAINLLELVRTGEVPLEGVPTTKDAIGGVKFSDTTEGTGRDQKFGGRKLRDYWF